MRYQVDMWEQEADGLTVIEWLTMEYEDPGDAIRRAREAVDGKHVGIVRVTIAEIGPGGEFTKDFYLMDVPVAAHD